MSLFKKKKEKVNTEEKVNTIYTGKAIFYHNNGMSTMIDEGTFAADKIEWLKCHIGRDAIWQNKNSSVNLKYFYSVQFEFKETK